MASTLLFSFLKSKSGFKLEDKLPISSGGRSSSAWSYSYDLKLSKMYEAASKLATKRDNVENSVSDVEDKASVRLSVDADSDNDFIFEGSIQDNELASFERIQVSEAENLDHKTLKNTPEYRPSSPRNKLECISQISIDESVEHVKCLRLSDVQEQRSWLGRVTRPFPKQTSDEMQAKKQVRSKSQMLVNYLEQFIQKTAYPAMQKYEQLQKEYHIEKKKWKKQVDYLKRQNHILKSELKDVNMAYKDAEKELAYLKALDLDIQNYSKIDTNSNTKRIIADSIETRISPRKYLQSRRVSRGATFVSDKHAETKLRIPSLQVLGAKHLFKEVDQNKIKSCRGRSLSIQSEASISSVNIGEDSGIEILNDSQTDGRTTAEEVDREYELCSRKESAGSCKCACVSSKCGCGFYNSPVFKERMSYKTVFLNADVNTSDGFQRREPSKQHQRKRYNGNVSAIINSMWL